MSHPAGNGPFPQGLAADLLGRPANTAPPGLAGALLQGIPGVVSAPPMVPDGAQAPSQVEQPPPAVTNPRLTDDNVDRLARVLTAECQHVCNPHETQGVGSTVINRMNRDGTDKVADVAGGGAYAIATKANPDMMQMAADLLAGRLTDNTGGATHFYSPRSEPKYGASTNKWDIGGGLEQIPGGSPLPHPMNWSPGFANGPKAYPQNTVANARDWVVKFYTQPRNGRVH